MATDIESAPNLFDSRRSDWTRKKENKPFNSLMTKSMTDLIVYVLVAGWCAVVILFTQIWLTQKELFRFTVFLSFAAFCSVYKTLNRRAYGWIWSRSRINGPFRCIIIMVVITPIHRLDTHMKSVVCVCVCDGHSELTCTATNINEYNARKSVISLCCQCGVGGQRTMNQATERGKMTRALAHTKQIQI